jgi:hypothetical protein
VRNLQSDRLLVPRWYVAQSGIFFGDRFDLVAARFAIAELPHGTRTATKQPDSVGSQLDFGPRKMFKYTT